jgi:hypothetical protein
MIFRFLISISLFFLPLSLLSGNSRVKLVDLIRGYKQKIDQFVDAVPELYLDQEKWTELAKNLREEGLERLQYDTEAVEVAQKIATALLNMAYEHIDQLNQQVQAVGNQITLNLKSEGYSDEQIIKGFLIFYAQSSELFHKSIFSGLHNVWKGAVVTVRSNGFLFKLFGNHIREKVNLS